MNKVPLIIFFCIFISCIPKDLPPSERSSTELDQADRIILISNETDLYRKLGQFLTDEGYTIKNSDSDLQTIQTEPKKIIDGIYTYNLQITASIRNNEVHFYGNTGNSLTGFVEADNRSGLIRRAYNKMKETAFKFPHEKVYYERR